MPISLFRGLNRSQLRLRSLQISPVGTDCTDAMTHAAVLLSQRLRDGLTSLKQLPLCSRPRSLELFRGVARFSNLRILSLVRVDDLLLPPAGMMRLPASLRVLSLSAYNARRSPDLDGLLQGLGQLETLSLKGFQNVPILSRPLPRLRLVSIAARVVTVFRPRLEQSFPLATLRVAADSLEIMQPECLNGPAALGDRQRTCKAASSAVGLQALHLSFSELRLLSCCRACAGNTRSDGIQYAMAADFVDFAACGHAHAIVEVQSTVADGSFIFKRYAKDDSRGLASVATYPSAGSLASELADVCAGAEMRCCAARKGVYDIVIMRRCES